MNSTVLPIPSGLTTVQVLVSASLASPSFWSTEGEPQSRQVRGLASSSHVRRDIGFFSFLTAGVLNAHFQAKPETLGECRPVWGAKLTLCNCLIKTLVS